MERNEIFRDTKNYYLETESLVSKMLINFARKYAGSTILDIGCATGEYCHELKKFGFSCMGVDINPEYIKSAKEYGIEAYAMNAENLKFPDNSIDTVLLFEVLEHVSDPQSVLKEAKRVARKNILITVPNCTDFFELKKLGLTYEHMLEKDHLNFFAKEDLEKLLSKDFKRFKVEEKEPLRLGAINLPRILKYPVLVMYKLKLVKSNVYYRLYAVTEVD